MEVAMPHLARHPEVVYTDLEDGAVLLHGETKFFYSLNEVGAAIWRWLDSIDTDGALVEQLLAEYDVREDAAKSSIAELVGELERYQLVVCDPGSPDSSGGSATGPHRRGGGGVRKTFSRPQLLKHAEPLHAVVMNPFDPQLPLAE
jgi:hypothetical protein